MTAQELTLNGRRARLTLADMARVTETSPATISRVLSGHKPKAEIEQQIAARLSKYLSGQRIEYGGQVFYVSHE